MTKNTNPTAFSNLAYPLHQNPIHGHREGSNYALSMVRTFKVPQCEEKKTRFPELWLGCCKCSRGAVARIWVQARAGSIQKLKKEFGWIDNFIARMG